MKKINLVLIIIVITITSYSQGGLQFNRVIDTGVSAASSSFINFTVPANKVLKVTNGSIDYALSIGAAAGDYATLFIVDLSNTSYKYTLSYMLNGPYREGQFINGPIWLNAGNYRLYLEHNVNFTTMEGGITGIEFNITP